MKNQKKAIAFLKRHGIISTAQLAVRADARMKLRGKGSRVARLLTAAMRLDAVQRQRTLAKIPHDASKCPHSAGYRIDVCQKPSGEHIAV